MTIWPYDSGSCGCDLCRPWGSNGFIYISEPIARLARSYFPKVRVTLATWYFDPTEWEGLAQGLPAKAGLGGLLDVRTARPCGRRYPEGCRPRLTCRWLASRKSAWRECTRGEALEPNPHPARFQSDWNLVKDRFQGGVPYSEGIFEDLNKVIFAQFYWNPDTDAFDTVRDYVGYECSPSVVTEMASEVKILEQDQHYRWWPRAGRDYNLPGHERWWKPPEGSAAQKDPGAEEAFQIVQDVLPKLPPYAQSSWRWRILYLRALLDEEFKRDEIQPTERAKEAIRELIEIYHADQAANAVRPAF